MSTLDLDHLDALMETIGRDRLSVLVERFAGDAARFVDTIEAAQVAGDAPALVEAAHRLAGMAALFGGVALTEAARVIESGVDDPARTAASARLRGTAELTLVALRDHLGSVNPSSH